VPFAQDEAMLHLELWGVASTVVLVVAGRVFPRFLLLKGSHDGTLRVAISPPLSILTLPHSP
jgi:hypothetical protein